MNTIYNKEQAIQLVQEYLNKGLEEEFQEVESLYKESLSNKKDSQKELIILKKDLKDLMRKEEKSGATITDLKRKLNLNYKNQMKPYLKRLNQNVTNTREMLKQNVLLAKEELNERTIEYQNLKKSLEELKKRTCTEKKPKNKTKNLTIELESLERKLYGLKIMKLKYK